MQDSCCSVDQDQGFSLNGRWPAAAAQHAITTALASNPLYQQQHNSMTRSVLDDLGEEITGIVAPVSICMALVVVLVKALNPDGNADSSSVAIATIAYHEKVGGVCKGSKNQPLWSARYCAGGAVGRPPQRLTVRTPTAVLTSWLKILHARLLRCAVHRALCVLSCRTLTRLARSWRARC